MQCSVSSFCVVMQPLLSLHPVKPQILRGNSHYFHQHALCLTTEVSTESLHVVDFLFDQCSSTILRQWQPANCKAVQR